MIALLFLPIALLLWVCIDVLRQCKRDSESTGKPWKQP